MAQISIAVATEDANAVEQILRTIDPAVLRLETQGFDGAKLVEFLLTLSPVSVVALNKFYIERIRANNFVQFKNEDFEIKGVSEATLLRILEDSDESAGKS